MAEAIELNAEFEKFLEVESLVDAVSAEHQALLLALGAVECPEKRGALLDAIRQCQKAAFFAGARALAQESLDALLDHGTAVAGCTTPLRNPTECYDSAHANLKYHYEEVLGLQKAEVA